MTDLDWLKDLCERATEGHIKVVRYEHGGGRVYQELANGERSLIADFYGEADREAYIAARNLLGPLVEVLDHAAGMAGWADDGTYEAIKSALAAIAAERQRQEGTK